MAEVCEYCRIPITPASRCRYERHVMAFACTSKHRWLLQRPLASDVHATSLRTADEVTEPPRYIVDRWMNGEFLPVSSEEPPAPPRLMRYQAALRSDRSKSPDFLGLGRSSTPPR